MNVTINLLFSSINYNVNKHVLIFTNGHLYSSKILCSRPAAGRIYKHFIFIPAGAVPVYKFNFINSIFWTVSIQIFAIFSWAWLIPPHHCMWTILNFKSEFWLQLLGVSFVQLKTGFVILYHIISKYTRIGTTKKNYLIHTGCCKTTGKLWQHITETLYGVFLVFLGSFDCQIWAIFHFGTLWA